MLCKICKVPMVVGAALLPIWGNKRNSFSNCCYPIAYTLSTVNKCSRCGYSVSFYGRLYGKIVENHVELIDLKKEDLNGS